MTADRGRQVVRPAFGGVLLDWRGTLVVAPTYPWLVRTALGRLGRGDGPQEVEAVLARLRDADDTAVSSSVIDTDAAEHGRAYAAWFRAAGLDDKLSGALYAVESDVLANPFARDVGPLLRALRDAGVRIAIVSDIHVDLRPAFAAQREPDGSSWADLIDAWVLSFEVGVAKPAAAMFVLALERLRLAAQDVLMVGDRGGWDGAAAEVGITTLLVPPLRGVEDRRLQRVLDLVCPGAALG
ncbi:HAD family hydrolase [Cellulomonas hominis]